MLLIINESFPPQLGARKMFLRAPPFVVEGSRFLREKPCPRKAYCLEAEISSAVARLTEKLPQVTAQSMDFAYE